MENLTRHNLLCVCVFSALNKWQTFHYPAALTAAESQQQEWRKRKARFLRDADDDNVHGVCVCMHVDYYEFSFLIWHATAYYITFQSPNQKQHSAFIIFLPIYFFLHTYISLFPLTTQYHTTYFRNNNMNSTVNTHRRGKDISVPHALYVCVCILPNFMHRNHSLHFNEFNSIVPILRRCSTWDLVFSSD